jgi:hypothetical protein
MAEKGIGVLARSSTSLPLFPPPDDLDALCLETACAGVLLAFWCEIKTYSSSYGVSESALRAMVECSFLSELDDAQQFTEEEPRPLTRTQFLRVLKAMKRAEEVRVACAKYPYRVPDADWDEMIKKAKGKRRMQDQEQSARRRSQKSQYYIW